MTFAWEDFFPPTAVPEWLVDFEREPYVAVDELLRGQYYFGHLNVSDPEDLLIDWALAVGEKNDFSECLDDVLAEWVTKTWGKISATGSPTGAVELAIAWSRLANVVAYVRPLKKTAEELRSYFDDRQAYLGPLSTSPSRDPLGRYLFAIARHQKDRLLAPAWWELLGLPPDVPFYHGSYGVAGIRGLPPVIESDAGGFREEVPRSVVKLARSLALLSREGVISLQRAKDELLTVGKLTVAAYPFPNRWHAVFSTELNNVSRTFAEWLGELVPEIAPTSGETQQSEEEQSATGEAARRRRLGWTTRARVIARRLLQAPAVAIDEASQLISEQRMYAHASGDSYYIQRSLCNFASRLQEANPQKALEWAEEAQTWQPWNPITWSTLTQAMRRVHGDLQTLPVAWEAVVRFPNDPVVWNSLAEVLKVADRLPEAEEVYRQSKERFPDSEHAWSGLAEVLKDAGNLLEAEQVYRQSMEQFPNDPVACNGLAEILKDAGNLLEAEQVYRQSVKRSPNNEYAWSGLADVLKADRRLPEAEEVYRQSVAWFPNSVVPRIGLASVLRLLGTEHLPEALALVENVLKSQPDNVDALAEKARILVAMGRDTEAAAVFELVRKMPSPGQEGTGKPDRRDSLIPAPAEDNALSQAIGKERTREPASGELASPAPVEGRPPSLAEDIALSQTIGKERTREPASGELASPAPVEGKPPSGVTSGTGAISRSATALDRRRAAAIASEARFLRGWARRSERSQGEPDPEELRRRAQVLLDQLIAVRPYDARTLTEKGLLLAESGSLADARALLAQAVARFPSAGSIRYALARVEREQARQEKRKFDPSHPAAIIESWRDLRSLNSRFGPLARLGEGRAWLAQTDGQTVRDEASRSFGLLHKWGWQHLHPIGTAPDRLTRHPDEIRSAYNLPAGATFEEWWSRDIQAYLFGGLLPTAVNDGDYLDVIVERLDEYVHPIDVLEEDFANRLSV